MEKLVSAVFCLVEIPGFFIACIEKTNKFPKKKKLLGGRIENGEIDHARCVMREVLEESDNTLELEDNTIKEVCVLEGKYHLEKFFHAKCFVDKQNIALGKEIESLHFFPKDGKELLTAIANGDFLPRHGEAIKTFLYSRPAK